MIAAHNLAVLLMTGLVVGALFVGSFRDVHDTHNDRTEFFGCPAVRFEVTP